MIVARSCESDLDATWSLGVPAQLGCEEHAGILERGEVRGKGGSGDFCRKVRLASMADEEHV